MDSRLQEVLDHYEITKVLKEYCHGSDRGDFVQMAATYARDSWDDHGANKCPGPEYARRSMIGLERTNMCCHILGQSLIDVRGDEAGAETYFFANVRTSDDDDGEVLNQIGGRYIDTFLREKGHWRIKKRQVVREWSISWPVTRDWQVGVDWVEPQRSNEDPSCAVLGMPHSGIPDPGGAGLPPDECS